MLSEIDFNTDFEPFYGGRITIPSDCFFWRGCDTQFPILSERPAYFGSLATANEYAKLKGRKLGAFKTTKPLKVLDIRFMKVILKQLFHELKSNNFTKEDTNCILSTTVSFGLCSLQHQIKLLKFLYKDKLNNVPGIKAMDAILKSNLIIEQDGIRVADTEIDSYTMVFLKELFYKFADGFLSPKLQSAFHTEKDSGFMTPELILFNPKDAELELISPPHTSDSMNIPYLIAREHATLYTVKRGPDFKSQFYMKGGSLRNHAYKNHPLDVFNEAIERGNKRYSKRYKDATEVGKRWNKTFTNFYYGICLGIPLPSTNLIFSLD
jgi:hypothetical protein